MSNKGNHGRHARMSAGYPTSSSGQSEQQREEPQESSQEMASHLGESVGQMKEKAQEFASHMAGQAQEAWHGARDELQERFSNYSGRAGDLFQDGIEFIRRYPLASLAAAFGIGCLTSCALFALPRSTSDVPERMSRASS